MTDGRGRPGAPAAGQRDGEAGADGEAGTEAEGDAGAEPDGEAGAEPDGEPDAGALGAEDDADGLCSAPEAASSMIRSDTGREVCSPRPTVSR